MSVSGLSFPGLVGRTEPHHGSDASEVYDHSCFIVVVKRSASKLASWPKVYDHSRAFNYGLYVYTCVFLLHHESFDMILVNNPSLYDGGVIVSV
jgi:hypothetical protein